MLPSLDKNMNKPPPMGKPYGLVRKEKTVRLREQALDTHRLFFSHRAAQQHGAHGRKINIKNIIASL